MKSRITVIFPLFNAEEAVADLVSSICAQTHPAITAQEDWLEVIFIDNASEDDTVQRLRACLAEAAPSYPIRVIENETNLGLARSFNRALGMTSTEFVLTCHADCRFGHDEYVATMLELLARTPDAAVVTGQPRARPNPSRVEKVYLTANLMDLFPAESDEDLVDVGFAEGRCDAFRMDALRRVGFYETDLRRAGEDQVMAARLRAAGYRLYQAPRQEYVLSVSTDQDSLGKLVRHTRLFGRVYPYIVVRTPGTLRGLVGAQAGANRSRRARLRLLQLLTGGTVAGTLLARGRTRAGLLAGLVGLGAARAALFRPYVRHLDLRSPDLTALALLQPAMDAAFYVGLVEGTVALAWRRDEQI